VTQNNNPWLTINAIKVEDDSNLYSFQIDTSKCDFNNLYQLCKSH